MSTDYVKLQELAEEKQRTDAELDEKIEQAAIAADPVGYRAIIKNVAQGIRYEETGYYGCRSDFFRARRRFFAALDESMEPKGQRMSV